MSWLAVCKENQTFGLSGLSPPLPVNSLSLALSEPDRCAFEVEVLMVLWRFSVTGYPCHGILNPQR